MALRGVIAGVLALVVIGQAPARERDAVEGTAADEVSAQDGAPRAVLSVRTENGEGTVFYHGEVVWSGPLRESLRTKRVFLDGEEFAAAFDGPRVVWENRKRAGSILRKSSQRSARPSDRRILGAPNWKSRDTGIRVVSQNEESVVIFGGKEVWRGKAPGGVSAKMKRTLFHEYAAAFAGGEVIWENVPGAGQRLLE